MIKVNVFFVAHVWPLWRIILAWNSSSLVSLRSQPDKTGNVQFLGLCSGQITARLCQMTTRWSCSVTVCYHSGSGVSRNTWRHHQKLDGRRGYANLCQATRAHSAPVPEQQRCTYKVRRTIDFGTGRAKRRAAWCSFFLQSTKKATHTLLC